MVSMLRQGIVERATITGGGGGTSIGGTVTGGTPPAVLFIGTGSVLAQDPTNFFYTDSTDTLTAKNITIGTGAAAHLPLLYWDGDTSDAQMQWVPSKNRTEYTRVGPGGISYSVGSLSTLVDNFLAFFALFGDVASYGMGADLGVLVGESKAANNGLGFLNLIGLSEAGAGASAGVPLYSIYGYGSEDGANLTVGSTISTITTEDWSAGSQGAELQFGTIGTGDSGASSVKRLVLGGTQDLGVGSQSYALFGDSSQEILNIIAFTNGFASVMGTTGYFNINFWEGRLGGSYNPANIDTGSQAATVVAAGENTGSNTLASSFLADFSGFGNSNGSLYATAGFAIVSTQNWSSTAAGGKFTYYTTPNNSIVRLERGYCDQDGQWYHHGNFKLDTVGSGYSVKEGTNGMQGSDTLASGTRSITINGISASTHRAFVQRTSASGTLGTGGLVAVITSNTLTVTSVSTLGVTATTDTSAFSYEVFGIS